MSSDRNRRVAFILVARLALALCLLVATGCAGKRALRDASTTISSNATSPTTLSPKTGAPASTSLQTGGYERGQLANNRSCTELTSDAEDLTEKMASLASRRKKALLFVPKTVLSVFKRATGRAESAEELARKYEQRRAMVTAINAALESKGCPRVELPPEPETKASRSRSGSGPVSGSTRARY